MIKNILKNNTTNSTTKINHSNEKKSVALSSVFASLLLTITKFVVGILTGSIGIISEAAHSALDLAAAIMTYFAVKIGDKPADESHPYGHGKVESVSALGETGLLFITSIWIVYEAVHRLFLKNVEIDVTWYAFAVIILSIVVDYSRSRALKKVADKTQSQALEADALHFSSDIWSSAVVLIGLIFVSFGIKGADAIAAMGVAVFVIIAGYRLGKRTIDVLIDSAPAGIAQTVKFASSQVKEVRAIEKIRVRPMGPTVFIDFVIQVDRKLTATSVHEIVMNVEKKVLEKIPGADIVIHTKPIQLSNESIVELIQLTAANKGLHVHDVVVISHGKIKYVSYDLEVQNTFTVKKAHDIATQLEDYIKKELGKNVKFNTHIEPLQKEILSALPLQKKEIDKIQTAIAKIVKDCMPLHTPHDLIGTVLENKITISVHCYTKENTPLEEAHTAASRLEYLTREKLPNIRKVVVHVEPEE